MSADEDLKSRDHDPRIFNLGLDSYPILRGKLFSYVDVFDFQPHEWSRQYFPLHYQYNIKQTSDENK